MKLSMIFMMLGLLISLSSCGAKVRGVPRAEINIPVRPPIRPVDIFACYKDEKCPSGTVACLNQKNFANLQENVINSETYIQKLVNLLKSLQK